MRIVWAIARVLPVLVERLLLIQDTLGYTGLHFNFSTLPPQKKALPLSLMFILGRSSLCLTVF